MPKCAESLAAGAQFYTSESIGISPELAWTRRSTMRYMESWKGTHTSEGVSIRTVGRSSPQETCASLWKLC